MTGRTDPREELLGSKGESMRRSMATLIWRVCASPSGRKYSDHIHDQTSEDPSVLYGSVQYMYSTVHMSTEYLQ